MPDVTPIVRALTLACHEGETVTVPTSLLRALLADYQDAADARERLHGYQQRLSQMVSTATSWAEVDG